MIDTSFEFTSDCAPDLDPERWSPTLHRYHAALWGRALPNGRSFELEDARGIGGYLVHRSGTGREYWLSSDAVIQTFTRWRRPEVASIASQVNRHERAEFYAVAYTIGAMMLFPGRQIDGRWTINQARGCHGQIADRFDLTLECIRRHYLGQPSPLSDVLCRYADFFDVFQS
jgi:hypothetical protein